jgi:hypothetical protein
LVTFQIRITAVRGGDTTGYVALDDFLISSVDSCDVLPPEADPTRCPDGKFTCKNGECIDEVKKVIQCLLRFTLLYVVTKEGKE